MSQWLTKDVFLQVNNMSPQGVFQLQLQVAYNKRDPSVVDPIPSLHLFEQWL